MALKAGKRDIAALIEVLDADYDTVEQAAEVAIVKAWEMYEAKAKWTVVGQMSRASDGESADPAEASKIGLGRYGTEKQAIKAAEGLVYSSATHEEFRAWVLPVWNDSPATFFKQRKELAKKDIQGATHAELLSHKTNWQHNNPHRPESEYPGAPEPEVRSLCPICGQEGEEHDEAPSFFA